MATPPSAGAVSRCGLGSNGRWVDPKGYVFIRCPDPDHPNAKSKPGWIAEHVWVMSQLLGRPLRKGESVHHRNNIKHDNRRGNLELWHTHQPKGASVEDTVRWATGDLDRILQVTSVVDGRLQRGAFSAH
jgi:hypothetical protein